MKHLLLTTIAAVLVVGCGDSEREQEVFCRNNLKQICIALGMFKHDHDGKLPWQVSEKDGGSMEYISPRSDKNALLDAGGEPIFDENAWRHFLAIYKYSKNGSVFICPTLGKKRSGKPSSSDEVSYWLLTDEKLNFDNAKYPSDAFFSVCPHHPDKSYIASTAHIGAMNVHWPEIRQRIIKGRELKAEGK
jgi:hypothetical protein